MATTLATHTTDTALSSQIQYPQITSFGGIVITPSKTDDSRADKFLLCFTPFRDETKQDADAFIELFDFVLDRYSLEAKQLCFVVCDHASVNFAFAKKAQVPMIGCASHRLQLAVGKILEPSEKLLKMVHEMMVRLDTVKRRAELGDKDVPMPIFRNATRWSSTFEMAKRYFELKPFLDADDDFLIDVYLSPRQEQQLKSLLNDLKKLESVSKRLQADPVHDWKDYIRALFDGVISKFAAAKTHLVARPVDGHGKTVLKSPDFESGIVKVLRGREESLSPAEAISLRRLERVEIDSDDDDEDMSFADECEAVANTKTSAYINLQWIPGTSNEVERLFSRAGLVLTERRHRLYPATLEKLLILEYNDSLWDVYTVAEALRKAASARKENGKKKPRTD